MTAKQRLRSHASTPERPDRVMGRARARGRGPLGRLATPLAALAETSTPHGVERGPTYRPSLSRIPVAGPTGLGGRSGCYALTPFARASSAADSLVGADRGQQR